MQSILIKSDLPNFIDWQVDTDFYRMTTSRRGVVLCTSTVTLYHADGKHLESIKCDSFTSHVTSIAFVYFAGSLYHSSEALFIWSRVPETTLPPSYPGRANFSLISLKNSTDCLHENTKGYIYCIRILYMVNLG